MSHVVVFFVFSEKVKRSLYVVMYVEIFKTGVIFLTVTSKCIVTSFACDLWTDLIFFVNKCQFSDPDFTRKIFWARSNWSITMRSGLYVYLGYRSNWYGRIANCKINSIILQVHKYSIIFYEIILIYW
jgi:hypothetical protein